MTAPKLTIKGCVTFGFTGWNVGDRPLLECDDDVITIRDAYIATKEWRDGEEKRHALQSAEMNARLRLMRAHAEEARAMVERTCSITATADDCAVAAAWLVNNPLPMVGGRDWLYAHTPELGGVDPMTGRGEPA